MPQILTEPLSHRGHSSNTPVSFTSQIGFRRVLDTKRRVRDSDHFAKPESSHSSRVNLETDSKVVPLRRS
jgi:hypothetical protein